MLLSRVLPSSFALAIVSLSPAIAQEIPTDKALADDFHADNEIVVTAPYGKRLDILSGTSAIAGETLAQDMRGQIGDALTALPSVSATSFSPGASRPVLRGFQGSRVAVLTDGIGNIDASNTSADHAVTIESLTADRIEILRGPAVLLYGGQAVGGAVNIIDKRIPRAVPDEPIHIDALLGFASANEEASAGASVDMPIGGKFAVHVDGSYRKGSDLRSGGYIVAPGLRSQLLAQASAEADSQVAADLLASANARGKIPFTAVKTWTLGAGAAFIDDGGNLGLSFNIFDSVYGIPSRPGGEQGVSIDLRQYRFDLRGEVQLGDAFLDKLKVRTGYANYRHQELAEGEVGTLFLSKGIETRVELVQNEHGTWNGASGLQYQTRDFEAIGEEAFVPPNLTEQIGLFTLQEFAIGPVGIEASLRYDYNKLDAASIQTARSFSNISAALGLSYTAGILKFGANISRTGRAPSAEELFSNGPHLATLGYEIGNSALSSERSWNGELYLRYDGTPVEFSATIYANRFKNFIFETATGGVIDDLPVFKITQADARFIGAELGTSARLGHIGGFDIKANLVADIVRAKLRSGLGNVPRIPPARVLGGITLASNHLDLQSEAEWTADQNRTGANETSTAGFTVVNASAIWRPWGKQRNISFIASANNIFDITVRRAASFTKDFAPLAGRNILVTARLSL
jgi:iron complex outermembrane recepter protein